MSRSAIGVLALMWSVSTSCQPDAVVAVPCTPGASRLFSGAWSSLSDAQLQAEIERACGSVSVGFKEAGAVRGVDPQGRSLTSAETVTEMNKFLFDRGFVLEWQATDLPSVSGRLTVRPGLVSEIRHHPKIDYLEPVSIGKFASLTHVSGRER